MEPTRQHTTEILDWHRRNGGHNERPAGVALNLLGEAIELAIKAGARIGEIHTVVANEVTKASGRGEFTGVFDRATVGEEAADTGINLLLFCALNEIPLNEEIEEKLLVLATRKYRPTAWGSLQRDRSPDLKVAEPPIVP